MHQLTKIRIASQYACYSNESLLHQEQNSWSTMYLTIFYRDFQRLSHIANTWSIRDSHSFRTRICEILLITSFDAYIEVCSLKSESRFDNRLLVSDLNRCKSFIRFWSESLQICLSDICDDDHESNVFNTCLIEFNHKKLCEVIKCFARSKMMSKSFRIKWHVCDLSDFDKDVIDQV